MDKKLRLQLLQTIFGHFQQITQWIPHNPENAVAYTNKAESIIELLEVLDCGSTGGYDFKNTPTHECKYGLYDRFLTLIRKQHKYSDIKKVCYFSPESLCKYFNKLSELRESFNK